MVALLPFLQYGLLEALTHRLGRALNSINGLTDGREWRITTVDCAQSPLGNDRVVPGPLPNSPRASAYRQGMQECACRGGPPPPGGPVRKKESHHGRAM